MIRKKSKNLVYIPIFLIISYFLLKEKISLLDTLIITISIYIINSLFEKVEKFTNIKETFQGNELNLNKYKSYDDSYDVIDSNYSNLKEQTNDLNILENEENNERILDDNYIYNENSTLTGFDKLSEDIQPDKVITTDLNKLSFFASKGLYNKFTIDNVGNIKDLFGNIVGNHSSLKEYSDNIIDNYGNILDKKNNILGQIGTLDNIKNFFIDIAGDGKLEDYKLDSNGNVMDSSNNILFQSDSLKSYPRDSIINKFGFIEFKNNILGHIGGDTSALTVLIDSSKKGLLQGYMINNNGTISKDNINYGKLALLAKFDGNVIDQNGYIINNRNEIIGYIGGDEEAKKFLLLAAKNGELDDFSISEDGNIIDKSNKLVGRLEYLKRFTGSKIDNIGNLLDEDGNIIGHIGGPTENLRLLLKAAKEGELQGFRIDQGGFIINKELKKVGNFESLRGYPVVNTIDKYGNILNENNQFIGYIGGEIEAEKLLIQMVEDDFIDLFTIKRNGLIYNRANDFITKLDKYKVFDGSYIDKYGNILDKKGNIISHIDPINGITNKIIMLANEGSLKDFKINTNGNIVDFDNNIIASFDFFNSVPENLHIDKEGNINFNKVNIEKIQNIMQMSKLCSQAKKNIGKEYIIENNNIIDQDKILVELPASIDIPDGTKMNNKGDFITNDNIFDNICSIFDSTISGMYVKVNSMITNIQKEKQIYIAEKDIGNKFIYGYSYLHHDHWDFPNKKKPVCENIKPCRVCPKKTGGLKSNLMKWNITQ